MRMRRSPRVAITSHVKYLTPMTSTAARRSSIVASRPRWISAFTTRLRSSLNTFSASNWVIVPQSRAARDARKRSDSRLATFSSRCG